MRSAAEIEQFQQQITAYRSLSAFQSSILTAENHLAILGNLRSVCWKIFLIFNDLDQTQWLSGLAKSRSAYDDLRAHYLRALQNPDELESAADPLSESIESPWDALRKDEVIRQEIFQDVERCMPENTYFRQPETQAMMLDILFIYTKLNPDVGYRQGMHELLAPVLWVVERDSVETDEGERPLHQVLDAKYVEHDTFTLFAEIMKSAKSFYDPAGIGSQSPSSMGKPAHAESAMIIRSRRIFSSFLTQYDPGLLAHLEELDILPQLFLMRWIRLLLGREFSFDDTLQIWDLLFADDPNLDLVDYICVAMLLRIRWQLIEADTNEALMLLMRYPAPSSDHGPRTFVQDALYLRSHPGFESGYDIIKKYSDRVPLPFKKPILRPSTPDHGSSPGTPPSIRSRSPFVPSGIPTSFQSLINDATKGAMSRGEKWGLNQAVRDAVGEVKKNVQNLQAARQSTLGGGAGIQVQGHRTSANRSSTSSETAGTIAANVLRKMTALEQRNRQLSQMLDAAVADLWACEKEAAEGKAVGEGRLGALSVAIAKVQFVQVFLQDSTLPLPQEENVNVKPAAIGEGEGESESNKTAPPPAPAQPPDAATAEASKHADVPAQTEKPFPPPALAPSPIPAFARPAPTGSPPPVTATTSISTQHASATALSITHLLPPAKNPPPTPTPPRPRIEQSNYSWMLGQNSDHASDFARASTFAPADRRHRQSQRDKGFLFGEDSDVVGERRVVKGRTRKGSKDVRRGGDGSGSGEGAVAAEHEHEHEDIGLDDVRRGGMGPM